jgi:hypothetical protein
MRIREITEAWYSGWSDTLDSMQQLKATQAQRAALPTPVRPSAGTPDPRYPAGEVLPDPNHLLMVELPNKGRYFKDLKNAWYNEHWQVVPPAQTRELENKIMLDLYTQVADPRANQTVAPVRRPVNRRTKVAPR